LNGCNFAGQQLSLGSLNELSQFTPPMATQFIAQHLALCSRHEHSEGEAKQQQQQMTEGKGSFFNQNSTRESMRISNTSRQQAEQSVNVWQHCSTWMLRKYYDRKRNKLHK